MTECQDGGEHRPIIRHLRGMQRKTRVLASDYAYFSLGNDPQPQAFHDVDYLVENWSRFMDVVSVTERAMGCQSIGPDSPEEGSLRATADGFGRVLGKDAGPSGQRETVSALGRSRTTLSGLPRRHRERRRLCRSGSSGDSLTATDGSPRPLPVACAPALPLRRCLVRRRHELGVAQPACRLLERTVCGQWARAAPYPQRAAARPPRPTRGSACRRPHDLTGARSPRGGDAHGGHSG